MADLVPSPLALHRAYVSIEKRAAVIAICELSAESSHLRSISSVARAANVSREFIHSHPDLHSRVVDAIDRARGERRRTGLDDGTAAPLGTAERTTLINALTRARVARQKLETEVAQFRTQRRHDLGAKLGEMMAPTAIDRLAESALHERILAENSRLSQELVHAKALIDQLQDDLAASRLALAQELGGADGTIRLSDYGSQ